MRKKVHQIKEGREVLEKLQELSKENGKDDTELRDFAARFNRQDAAVQLQQGTGSLETAQLGAPQRRAAVETKNAEAPKSGLAKYADVLKLKVGMPGSTPDKKPFVEENHKWVNIVARGKLYFLGATVASGQLQQPGAYPINVAINVGHMVTPFRRGGPVERMLQWKVAADADPAKNQDPEADGGPNYGLALTDPVAPPMSVGQLQQPNEPNEAERYAQGWCENCVCGRGSFVRGRNRDHPHRRRQDQGEGCPVLVVQYD